MSRYGEDLTGRMVELYLAGWSYSDIASKVNVSEETARRRIQIVGVPPRPRGQRSPAGTNRRRSVKCDNCGHLIPVRVLAD